MGAAPSGEGRPVKQWLYSKALDWALIVAAFVFILFAVYWDYR